ncbi:MAG: thiol peroxidase [Bacteriovoracaceae bacterium]|nr:thiol peroxidase [Bacteriovoracaceae bacterium]
MAVVTLHGDAFNTQGELATVGTQAKDFSLVRNDLSEANLETFAGKKKILSIFPSLDTPTCAMSVRTFNKNASELQNVVILNISADLPFAQGRFCGAEGIDKVETLSTFRSNFGSEYNLEFTDGPLKGLLSRSIIILDENNKVIYSEQVAETADEPNYEAVLKALK